MAEDPNTEEPVRVVPGELRNRDVKVGEHVPVNPGALPRFLHRFERAYGNIGKTESILSTAAAQHRLVWMHSTVMDAGPFSREDGPSLPAGPVPSLSTPVRTFTPSEC